jgi:hypothetical protein
MSGVSLIGAFGSLAHPSVPVTAESAANATKESAAASDHHVRLRAALACSVVFTASILLQTARRINIAPARAPGIEHAYYMIAALIKAR